MLGSVQKSLWGFEEVLRVAVNLGSTSLDSAHAQQRERQVLHRYLNKGIALPFPLASFLTIYSTDTVHNKTWSLTCSGGGSEVCVCEREEGKSSLPFR